MPQCSITTYPIDLQNKNLKIPSVVIIWDYVNFHISLVGEEIYTVSLENILTLPTNVTGYPYTYFFQISNDRICYGVDIAEEKYIDNSIKSPG